MGKRLRRLPSPSMAVAFIALLATLTGTAVALPGSNSVTSGDIKNSQVKTQDIKNSTVAGKDVKSNTLTGSDVNEATLGKVPSATSADSAGSANSANTANFANSAGSTDGASFAKVAYAAPSGSANAPFFSGGGLTLSASCTGGSVVIRATTSVENSHIHWGAHQFDNPPDDDDDDDNLPAEGTSEADFSLYDEDDSFDVGNTELVFDANGTTSNAPDSTEGTVTFRTPGGTVVTAVLSAEEATNSLSSANDCFVTGNATVL